MLDCVLRNHRRLAERTARALAPTIVWNGARRKCLGACRRHGCRSGLRRPPGPARRDARSRWHPQCRPTTIPFDVEGRHIILVDDVLYTGRTTRAAINELFDYGRPASVAMAVLADRGGRELPIGATYCVWDVALQDGENLVLGRQEDGQLAWRLENA